MIGVVEGGVVVEGGLVFEDRGSYLYVKHPERYHDVEELKTSLDLIVDECRKIHCDKALVDVTNQKKLIDVMILWELGNYAERVLRRKKIKFAIFAMPDTVYPDRFLENVARNRGIPMKVFTDLEEAVTWL